MSQPLDAKQKNNTQKQQNEMLQYKPNGPSVWNNLPLDLPSQQVSHLPKLSRFMIGFYEWSMTFGHSGIWASGHFGKLNPWHRTAIKYNYYFRKGIIVINPIYLCSIIFYREKIYLLKIPCIEKASISVKVGLFFLNTMYT